MVCSDIDRGATAIVRLLLPCDSEHYYVVPFGLSWSTAMRDSRIVASTFLVQPKLSCNIASLHPELRFLGAPYFTMISK